MKPLVIYHADCTDGFGAAFAAWLKLGDSAEYLPMNYGQEIVPTQIADNREVYILDFSFPRHVMEGLFALAKRVVWLEHHKDAFEMWLEATPTHGQYVLGGPNTIWLDNNKSGALLAWEYFHPGTEVPRPIQYIDDVANRAVISELLYRLKAAENERDVLRADKATLQQMAYSLKDRLEVAEKERDWHAERCEDAMNECNALQAKIERMEKQEPVMWANSSTINSSRINKERGGRGDQHTCSETQTAYHDTQLYALPGAQGEEK